jgi:hypothetical protein
MTITNKLGLPEAIVKACTRERHNKPGELSATTLLKGVREIHLTKRHWEELTVDAADLIWALFGTATHTLLESEDKNEFTEEKLQHEVDGVTVTGVIDNYNMKEGMITDWKTASVWKVIYQNFDDWTRQGMVYAWLLRKNGFPVSKCRFVALLKDHSKAKAKYGNGYPKSPVYVHEFFVTADWLQSIEFFIKSKIESYKTVAGEPDDRLPVCSDEERWAEPPKYAVMKEGRKSAVKLHETRKEAEEHALSLVGKHYIENRPGSDRKCEDYCVCNKFCSYYRQRYGGEE